MFDVEMRREEKEEEKKRRRGRGCRRPGQAVFKFDGVDRVFTLGTTLPALSFHLGRAAR